MERYDAERKDSVKGKHDGDAEKKSITEEESKAVGKKGPPVAVKPTPLPRNTK